MSSTNYILNIENRLSNTPMDASTNECFYNNAITVVNQNLLLRLLYYHMG